jgi:hypothetical protein
VYGCRNGCMCIVLVQEGWGWGVLGCVSHCMGIGV